MMRSMRTLVILCLGLVTGMGLNLAAAPRENSSKPWLIPPHILEFTGPTVRVHTAFSARDLSVQQGEQVTALREVKGWLWCRNAAGEEGWLPEFVLRLS